MHRLVGSTGVYVDLRLDGKQFMLMTCTTCDARHSEMTRIDTLKYFKDLFLF
jgi:hypothetical protein